LAFWLKSKRIIDVTTPFENRFATFEAAKNEKRAKYGHIADHYRRQGYAVVEQIINSLKFGRHYWRVMRRLLRTNAIRWSRNMYVEHLTGRRQYEEQ
jgi:alanyl-tRNA synthetase